MERFDLAVIGSGPGGYVAALRAAQLKLRVALIEKDSALGGTCLNVGCIPSKALLEASEYYHLARERLGEFGVEIPEARLNLPRMMERKQRIVRELTEGIRHLMKKNQVAVFHGKGRLTKTPGRVRVEPRGGEGEAAEIEAAHILLAMGSVPVELPFLPFDGETVVSSTEALAFSAPPASLAVIGAGAVGLELGSVWRRLGSKVTVIEMLPKIVPWADEGAAKILDRALRRQGLDLRLGARVTGMERREAAGGARAALLFETADGKKDSLECDKILVAVGRRPASEGAGLEEAGVARDARGMVQVNGRFETTAANVFAIGDLIRGPMLAHKAEEEGAAAAEIIAGGAGHVNYAVLPNVIYTDPELAGVGLTEEEARREGQEIRVGTFSFRANGRAKTLPGAEGQVKLIADARTDRLLGAHIVGPRASDLIAELTLAMEFQASAEDIALTIHAHPTLPETIKEAALAVLGRPLHS